MYEESSRVVPENISYLFSSPHRRACSARYNIASIGLIYCYVLHNDVVASDGPPTWQWSHKIVLPSDVSILVHIGVPCDVCTRVMSETIYVSEQMAVQCCHFRELFYEKKSVTFSMKFCIQTQNKQEHFKRVLADCDWEGKIYSLGTVSHFLSQCHGH